MQPTIYQGDVLIKGNSDPATFGNGSLTIEGDLTVLGMQSDHQVETFIVQDNIIAIGEPPVVAGKDGGSIISRHIDDITSGPVTESGTAQGGSITTITLDSGANAANGYYNKYYIKITTGPGVGEKKLITGYVGASRVATVDTAWSTTPTAVSTYELFNKARIGMIFDETNDEVAMIATVDDHTASNPTISDYCDMHVGRIIQEIAQECIYYVGMHGDDTYTGFHINEAKETIGAALTAAAAETPDMDNQIAIVCFDACVYTENISIPSWVHVYAPNARIDGTIILANDSSVLFKAQELVAGTAITHSSGGYASAQIGTLILTGNANGVSNSGVDSVLKYSGETIELENGTGFSNSATGSGNLSVKVDDIVVSGIGTAVVTNSSVTNLLVNQITGGTAINTNGIVNGHVNSINSTTAYVVGATGVNNLFIGEISGTETVVAGGISNRIFAGILTSKGDLLTRTNDEYTRLGVGVDGRVLTADSSTPTGLKWVTGGSSSIVTYTLVKDVVKVGSTDFIPIAYFPWLDSRYNGYTSGVIVLRTSIYTRDLEIRFRDVTNGVTLHVTPVIISTSGSSTIIINANPVSDASIELQVRKPVGGGINPEILGCILEYSN